MNTMIKSINILIPTYKRSEAFADQSPSDEIEKDNSIQTTIDYLRQKEII